MCQDDGCGDASDDNNDVTDEDEDREIPEICGHSSATHNRPNLSSHNCFQLLIYGLTS